MNDILAFIEKAKKLHTVYEYLHGGCYAFAKALSIRYNGIVYVNRKEEHCVVKINNKFYDITGERKINKEYHMFRTKEEKIIAKEYRLSDTNEVLIEKLMSI